MSQTQQQQLDLNMQVSINLPLGAWNTVLNLIAKGPWDVADPLMQVIRAQVQAITQPRPSVLPQPLHRPSAPIVPRDISDREAG